MLKLHQSLKLILSNKIKNFIFIGAYILFLLFIGYKTYYAFDVDSSVADIPVYFLLTYSFFYFLLIYFFAYDFFLQIKTQFFEESMLTGMGKKGILLFWGAVSVIHTLMSIGITVYIIVLSSMFHNCTGEFVFYLIKASFLYIFLDGMAAIAIALCISKIKNRYISFACAAFFIVFTCPLLKETLSRIESGSVIRRIWEFFNIMPYKGNYAVPALYEFSIAGYRWVQILLWIAAAVLIIWNSYRIRGRKIITLFCTICLISGFYFFYQPHSVWGEIGCERVVYDYYTENHQPEKKEVEFKVLSYDMDMYIGNELKVSCIIKPDKQNLDKYTFTLYHTFRIKDVRNQDNERLKYKRDGDWITIDTSNQKTESIKIIYRGCPDNFYVDKNAVYLSGMFPYYPKAGKNLVYDCMSQQFVTLQEEKDTFYCLKLRGNTEVITNLEKVEKNCYEGYSNGLTLFGGFISSIETGGVTFYYPYLSRDKISEKECVELLNEIRENYQNGSEILEGKKIFITGLLCSGNYCTIFDNYIEATFLNSVIHGFETYERTEEKNVKN